MTRGQDAGNGAPRGAGGNEPAGRADEFQERFERYRRVLQAHLRMRLSPAIRRRVSVSDILQETRLAVHVHADRFEDRDEDSFRKWLFRIAENKALEAVRHHAGTAKRSVRREVTRGDRKDTGRFVGSGPSPSQAAMRAESSEMVNEILRSLPPDYERVLRMSKEAGLTMREIAERLGKSTDAIKKLYGRALERFGRDLGDRGKGACNE